MVLFHSEAHSGPQQTSLTEPFAKLINTLFNRLLSSAKISL